MLIFSNESAYRQLGVSRGIIRNMTKYLVTYYGSESGWVSTTQDFGVVEADSEEAACELVALREVPHDEPISRLSRQTTRSSFRMYLTATPVTI
jgi:hypothetical protein